MTKIEWTHRPGTTGVSWNPIRARNKATGGVGHFCVHVSAGCANCYAERMQKRLFNNPIRYAAQDREKVEIFLDDMILTNPLRWKKPRTIFICSMTDLFGEWVEDAWLDSIFAVMALCPQHTFIVLTKRPARMRDYFCTDDLAERWWEAGDIMACEINLPEGHGGNPYLNAGKGKTPIPLPNVWLGVSVEDQTAADLRIPDLLATPAAVRFLSIEPLLGPIDCRWTDWAHKATGESYRQYLEREGGANEYEGLRKIDWLIIGGESGPGARPMHPDWARSLRDQCGAAGVPFFFKQWGEWLPLGQSGFHYWSAANMAKKGVRNRRWLGHAHFNDGNSGPETHSIGPVETQDFLTAGKHMSTLCVRIGKKAAGALLDGREWREWPKGAGNDN